MKSIGVVIPIYNTEKYLAKCVESVLNQNYEALQVVLVDDGSSDDSGEICDDFARRDSRVKVIHQVNKGKIESRYIGAANAKTDYITFVDSDDWIAENTYNSLLELLDQGIDIISYKIIRYISDCYQIKSGGKIREGIFQGEKYKEFICSTMIWDDEINSCGIDPSLCNKLFKRDIILPQLDKARKICISYGDDVAVVYPTLYKADSYAIADQYKYYHRRRIEGEIPEYFLDNSYYKKLVDLYEYLRERFDNQVDYVRQLDMFFAYSATLRLRKYGVENHVVQYMAPFDKIPQDSKIILCGAGKVGQSYYKQITELDYCEIVAWVDNVKTQCAGVSLSKYNVFAEMAFDYVVMALKSKDAVDEITKIICKEYNVNPDKIIWEFHEHFG